jgi:phosphatidylglycerol:prolipoprotein diacylglycerol transferase
MVGARLFYVLQYWGVRIHHWTDVFKVWEGGIVLYGSILGGTAAFLLYWARRRFPLRPTIDAIAPALALGIAIGRLGCFLNGCCYGDTCELPWAVAFPPASPPWWDQVRHDQLPAALPFVEAIRGGAILPGAPWSHPVHPTQLYSTLGCAILTALLLAYYPLRRRDGEVFALLMVTYPVHRFLVEWLRNDEGTFLAGLTISQALSVAVLACGLVFWIVLARQPERRYADLAAPDGDPEAPIHSGKGAQGTIEASL